MKKLKTTFAGTIVVLFLLLTFHFTNGQTWTSMAGFTAEDISIGKGGVVWATGKDLNVYRWNGANWENMKWPGVRIAADVDGSAWAIHPKGYLYKYNATTGKFDTKPGQATDIAIGADGSVWKIGVNKTGNDYDISKWDGTNWINVPGDAVRVAVDPSGKAWVVNSAGTVYSYETSGWTQRPGSAKGGIAIGADGSMWCTALDERIYQWGNGNWILKTGAAVNISISPDGNPWVVNSAGKVYRVGSEKTVKSRSFFPSNREYWEQKIFSALIREPRQVDPNFIYFRPSDVLQKVLARLALNATESFYAGNTVVTPENAESQINSSSIIRSGIYGVLSFLMFEELKKNGIDEQAQTLKAWATEVYRNMRIRVAYSILQQYQKWKSDPCGYSAEGYKRPPDCVLRDKDMATLFSGYKAPEDVLARAGMKSTVSSNADEIAAGVTVAAAACGMVAAFAGVTAVMTVGVAVAEVSLNVALAAGIAATLGVGTVGFVAAPVTAAILCVVVGTIQGFQVVEAERVEPMLKMKLGAAMTDPINIVNTIADSNSRSMFFLALQEAAINKFQLMKRKDINGEVRFYCQAGYVSKFKLSYTAFGTDSRGYPIDKPYEFTTNELAVGNEESFAIPYDAKNIKVQGWYALAGWKEIFNQPVAAPSYLCYTTYGTVFEPKYKTDCPEVANMTTKPNELTVTQGGGYLAWVKLTYTQNGKTVVVQDQTGFSLGWRKVYAIPKDATNINLVIKDATGLSGLLGSPWKTIIDKTWPLPPNECIKVYGTTLDPKWNSECN